MVGCHERRRVIWTQAHGEAEAMGARIAILYGLSSNKYRWSNKRIPGESVTLHQQRWTCDSTGQAKRCAAQMEDWSCRELVVPERCSSAKGWTHRTMKRRRGSSEGN